MFPAKTFFCDKMFSELKWNVAGGAAQYIIVKISKDGNLFVKHGA